MIKLTNKTREAWIRKLDEFDQFLTKKNWVQNNAAIDSDGNAVEPKSKYAVKFCAIGAFDKLKFHPLLSQAIDDFVEKQTTPKSDGDAPYLDYPEHDGIVSVNDSVGLGAVKKFTRKFKKSLEKELTAK